MRRRLLALALAVLLAAPVVAAQDLAKARALLAEALLALQPAPLVVPIATPAALDLALTAAAAAGVPDVVLTLSPALVYPTALTLRAPITLQTAALPGPPLARIARGPLLATFLDGITVVAEHVTLVGLEVRRVNPLADILVVQGAHVTLDRVRVLGDPVRGAKRCISANSNGDLRILRAFVDDCFASSPGADSQALAAWDMAPGLLVEDSYLSGGSETVLLGGADAPEDRTPADIVFHGNTLTKNPAWQTLPVGVKCLVELKNAKRVLFENNVGSYAWVNGQTGYLVVLSVRNQDGRAPWATIQDVLFRNNTWSDGGGAINILGRDDIRETGAGRDVPVGTVRRSVPMARVTIQGDTFSVDPVKYAKTSNMKLIMLGGGPVDTTIDGVTVTTLSTVGSSVYWASGPPAVNFALTNTTLPRSSFGMFSVAGGSNKWTVANVAWSKYVQGGTIANITEVP